MRLAVNLLCVLTGLALALASVRGTFAEDGSLQGTVQLQGTILLPEPSQQAVEASAPEAIELATHENSTAGLSIFVMGIDGRGLRVLHPMGGHAGQGSPSWSHDGKKIAFDAWKPNDDEAAHAFVVNLSGAGLRDLGPGAMPTWSPVNDELLLSQHLPNWGTFSVSPTGGRRTKVVNAFGAMWSPDAKKLAVITPPGKGLAVFELESERLIPVAPNILHGGSWSPEGSRFCAIQDSSDGLQELAIVSMDDPAGNNVTVRLKGRMYNQAKWSPDGKWILFSQQIKPISSFQLYVVAPDGDSEPLLVQGQDPRRNNFDATWSPDGTKIAFASQPNLTEITPAVGASASTSEERGSTTSGDRLLAEIQK
jgi:Tol biopolymer transport system component